MNTADILWRINWKMIMGTDKPFSRLFENA
jgi:hypothetical protein